MDGTREIDVIRRRPYQFNWRRHWKKKVAPHLHKELVQKSLDLGMKMLDPYWERGDPPYQLGAIPMDRTRVVTGKLSWYQVWGRCHYIAYFSMAIGVLNYPRLDWRFVRGDLHCVPVGYGPDGEAVVVMDILLFADMTAEQSLAHATRKVDGAPAAKGSGEVRRRFVKKMVPALRALAESHAHPSEVG